MLGLLSALVMLLAAPLAARFYHEPQLFGLIAVVAVGNVCVALGTVPNTLLSIQLRFRLQSLIALVSAILIVVLNVLMAWRHCGAYSFVVPTVVVGVDAPRLSGSRRTIESRLACIFGAGGS